MFTYTTNRGQRVTCNFKIDDLIAKRLDLVRWDVIMLDFDLTRTQLMRLRNSTEYHKAIGQYLRRSVQPIPPKYQQTFGVDRDAYNTIMKEYI